MKKSIIKFNKFIISFFLVLLSFTINVNSESKKNILYISSGTATYGSTYDQMQGFNDAIRNTYEVCFEHMNSLKYPNKEHEEAFYSLLKSKLKIYPHFDAVVLSDDAAAFFAIKHKDLFKDTPMFLTSINNNELIDIAKRLDIECIIEENLPISQNINIIGNIYNKKAKKSNLVLVTGPDDIYSKEINEFYSLEDKYNNFNFKNVALSFKDEKEINEKLKKFNKNEDILFFLMPTSSVNSKKVTDSNTNFSSITQIIKAIKDSTDAPIFTSASKGIELGMATSSVNSKKVTDSNTNFSSITQIIKAIKDSTDAPIFTSASKGIELGMVGGYTVDLYKQGKVTGDIVNKFFEGEKDIPSIVKGEDTSSLVFSYKEILKYNISRSKIPKDAELVFKSDSILSKYKNIIITVVIIFGLISIFISIHYITTIKANKKLKEAKKIAEEANKSKDSFIANISHELRTPVNVISSTAQLIKKNINSNKDINIESIYDNITMIEQNSHRLTRLINNIIDVTKSDIGEKSLILQNIEIVGLIENSVLSVVPFAEAKNINIIFDTEYEELIMAVDIDKIDRVILNLLSNAIKFSHNGGDVLVNLMCEKDNLIIEVTDFGIGISDENIEIIFEKFMQIDNGLTRLNEGSGIGLSLVKSFIKMHKGSINVDTKLGKGTTFKISIPINIIDNGKIIYNISEINSTSIELSDIYI